jgi:4-hydroxybenzoate polyprenyltransferase
VELVPRSIAATRLKRFGIAVVSAVTAGSLKTVAHFRIATLHLLYLANGYGYSPTVNHWPAWLELLRWQKPSGRLILLLPACWSLWLESSNPNTKLLVLILVGGLAVSGAGCIINDLWDRRIDSQVARTRLRPLARGALDGRFAIGLLLICLAIALAVVWILPHPWLCLGLALICLPLVLIYPSAKRWFAYPQLILATCWGFAVLIPWAAARGSLTGGWPLWGCWASTIFWTFGFDSVYAMADRLDDQRLGVRSSALSLGPHVVPVVGICYAAAWFLLISAALTAGAAGIPFGGLALLAGFGFSREWLLLRRDEAKNQLNTGKHFKNQVLLGALLLFALVLNSYSK